MSLMSKISLCVLVASALHAKEQKIGIVNFSQCVQESKFGKEEHTAFEAAKQKMTRLVTDIETQIKEITDKFNDADYLDGLSPEEEQALKVKYAQLREEHERYQNQFYQIMNQTNMQVMQKIWGYASDAADKVAHEQEYSLIVQKDNCFFSDPANDITSLVLKEMDRRFDEKTKETADKNAKKE